MFQSLIRDVLCNLQHALNCGHVSLLMLFSLIDSVDERGLVDVLLCLDIYLTDQLTVSL